MSFFALKLLDMSCRKVFIWVFIINISYSSYILEGTPNNRSFHHVTSSEIRQSREEIHKELDKGSINFKITLEPLIELELCIGRRNLNVFDKNTKFKVFGDDEIIILKQDHMKHIEDILVEGFVHPNNKSSFVIGYIRNTEFYGTVEVLGYIYTISSIDINSKLFKEYEDSSFNAMSYKIKKNNEDLKMNITMNEKLIAGKDFDYYRSIIGNG